MMPPTSFLGLLVSSLAYLLTSKDRIVHLNHAGASPSPPRVLERVQAHYRLEQEMGGYVAGEVVADELASVYSSVAALVQAASVDEIALVESATVAWTRLFYAFAQHIKDQDEFKDKQAQQSTTKSADPKMIWISEAEYAANVVAICRWARTHCQWTVRMLPSAKDADGRSTGKVDIGRFSDILQGRTEVNPAHIAMVCVTEIPTNSGIVNPVRDIGSLIADYNEKQKQKAPFSQDDSLPCIWYLVDACQSVGQREVNVQQIQCHGLVATGRKYLRAPRGTGFLYCVQHIADRIWPSHIDHASAPIKAVPKAMSDVNVLTERVEDLLDFEPRPGAKRFEFWESNIASKLGLGQAVRIAQEEELHRIAATIQELAGDLYQKLSLISGVRLHHLPECGIVTFWLENVDSTVVKGRLWEMDAEGTRVEVSVVPATSTPLDSGQSGVPDMIRASLSYTNSKADILLLCSRLSSIDELF
jgi:cysteine desulfurase/selenocysteine lyase